MAGVAIGLLILIFLAFMGWSVLWAAPVAAMAVALLNGADLLGAYAGAYMEGLSGFLKSYFPLFLLGAIFGKLMEATGMAGSIAANLSRLIGRKRAILAVVVSCACLTYGGVSLFVVVFAIYPIACGLFNEANIARKLMPAAISLGSYTFTMTALPGSPQIQNLIPMDYFHTTASAAPVLGVVASIIMAALGYWYLLRRQRQLAAAGEGFDGSPDDMENAGKPPSVWLSALPLAAVVFTLNVLHFHIITALLLGNVLILALNYKKYKDFIKIVNAGAAVSVVAVMNTSAAVGFGAVVQSVPAFSNFADALAALPGSPLVSLAVAVNLLAGATGSASGGLGIALAALGERYYAMAVQTGIPAAAFHRVASIACGGLDSLPHNGALLTLFAVTGTTHKSSYKDLAMTVMVSPFVALAVIIVLAGLGVC